MHPEETLMMDPLQKEPETGDLVQGYQLGKLLGKGAHGSVYLANKPGEAKSYAVKIIDTQGHPRTFIDRVMRECAICTKLRHPGIIPVHEAGYWGACIFIVMDVATGRSSDHYAEGTLGWELSLEMIRQVARALDHAYQTNHIIHRDIKPANIVVDMTGGGLRSVRVVDFGLSRSVDEEGEGLTMTGMVLGTPFYMSPEQARGDRDLTFHTDMYALGATLFFLVAGKPPFHSGTAVEILLKHCNEDPPLLKYVAPKCPEAVSALAARCLEKDPAKRFPSYAALIAEIDRLLGSDPFEGQGPPETPGSVTTRRTASTGRQNTPAPPQAPLPQLSLDNEPDPREGSTTSGSDALGSLLRGKLQETTKTFRKQSTQPRLVPIGQQQSGTADAAGAKQPEAPAVQAKPQSTTQQTVADREPPKPKPRPQRKPSIEPGTQLDSVYVVTGNLGAGAMGEVYAVEDRVINHHLAMKILSDDDMRRPGALRRFHGECSALATVEHHAFPYFAGKGVFRGRDYLLMERVKGVDLKTWLQRNGGRMGEAGALSVVLQLAEAMDRAYAKCGMVHRDIKPANLMFTLADGEQRVKIVDFGVSTYIDYGDFEDFSDREYKYIDDDSQGKAVGTPAYMSPEQCVGAPPSPLMDIYAIGCTFFHLIAGRTPYQAPNTPMMMMKHLQEAPPTFDGVAEVSNGASYLLKRLMAKNPRDRFKNYEQIIAAVQSAAFTSSTTRIRRPVVPPAVPAVPTTVPGSGTWRRPGT